MIAKAIKPVRANLGIQTDYLRRMRRLIEKMEESTAYWVKAAYRGNEPATVSLAMDESAVAALKRVLRALARRWQRNFNEAAEDLARYFSKSVAQRSDAQLMRALKKGGYAVPFTQSAVMRDALNSVIAQNVGLIRSIPRKYLGDVEQAVMRSAAVGRDLEQLAQDIREIGGVSRRRAALIARDQTNKATTAMTRARQLDIGIEEGVWRHSHAGKEPRPTHVANDGKRFNIREGWLDPAEGEYIMPGDLINCFPASTNVEFADGVEKAYRRLYAGELAEIVTDSGKTLRATPNHPVLTPDGFVPIGLLDEGDHVIEIGDQCVLRESVEGHVDHAIPTIAKVFGSLAQAPGPRNVAVGGEFHGDRTDGDVDVVSAAGALSFGLQVRQRMEDFCFPYADGLAFGAGFVRHLSVRCGAAASGNLGGPSQLLSTFDTFASHPDIAGRASVSNGAPGHLYSPRYERARYPVSSGQGEDALTLFMIQTQPRRVVHKDRIAFVGHVFNLQTRDGFYIANGLVVHNCRCFWTPLIHGE